MHPRSLLPSPPDSGLGHPIPDSPSDPRPVAITAPHVHLPVTAREFARAPWLGAGPPCRVSFDAAGCPATPDLWLTGSWSIARVGTSHPTGRRASRLTISGGATLSAANGERSAQPRYPARAVPTHSRSPSAAAQVGSRAGAVPRRLRLGCLRRFRLRARVAVTVSPSPAPARSNRACGFPAHGFPARFAPRVMGRIRRTALSAAAAPA